MKVILETTGLPSDYTFENKEVSIPANSEVSTSLVFNVPHDKDGGKENIGNVIIKGAADVQLGSVTLSQETKSMLELNEFKVKYIDEDGDKESDSFDENDEVFEIEKNVKPYTEMSFIFKVKNLLDDDYNVDLENILLTIESDDDFFDEDFEEEYELDKLRGKEDTELTITFIISEDADANDHTIEITLEGEDEEGSDYKIERELVLSIEKNKDDLRVFETKITSETIAACEEEFSFLVKMKNLGSKDQKFAGISIFNEELGINENIQNIKIERHGDDDLWEEEFVFSLKDAKVKTYDLDVTTYVDKDEPVDFKRVKLEVGKCKVEKEVVEEEDKTEVITSTLDINENDNESEEEEELLIDKNNVKKTNGNKEGNTALTSSTIIETVEDSYSQEDFLVGIILVAIVIVLALIIIFFVVLLK